MAESKTYRVEVTKGARDRFQRTILPYLFRNFSESRVFEIDRSLEKATDSLSSIPFRGSIEHQLGGQTLQYRFILFRETRYFELKILYFVDEINATVFVVDYFPTAMHPKRMTSSK